MTFLGLVAFGDEVRSGVRESVARLTSMGVQVKMVTGDAQRTGAAVARAVGILPMAAGAQQKGTGASSSSRSRSRSRDNASGAAGGASGEGGATMPSSASDALLAAASLASGGPDAPIAGVCVGRQGELHHRTSSSLSTSTTRSGHHRDRSSRGSGKLVAASSSTSSPAHSRTVSSVTGTTGLSKASSSASLAGAASSVGPSRGGTPSPSALASPAVYDLSCSVFCRFTPADKLALLRGYQSQGHRVLVTASDASEGPMLAEAEASVAMGSSHAATDVAREGAGMVLVRDDFRGVVTAILTSRRARANLAASLCFFLATRVAMLVLFLSIAGLGMDMPLSPLQMVLLQTVGDLAAWGVFNRDHLESTTTASASPAEEDAEEAVQEEKEAAAERDVEASKEKAASGTGGGKKTDVLGGMGYVLSVLLCGLLLSLAVGSVLFLARHAVLVSPEHGHDHHHHHDGAAEITALDESPFAARVAKVKDAAGGESIGSAAAPSARSAFFPEGLLRPFVPDEQLALTQSLVMWGWMLGVVMLALFVRGGGNFFATLVPRSSWFGCCDRTSVAFLRARQRDLSRRDEMLLARGRRGTRWGSSGEDEDDLASSGSVAGLSPRSSLSAAMRAGRGHGYDSLSQAEEGGLGAHRAFLAGSSSSSSSAGPSAAAAGGVGRVRSKSSRREASGRSSASAALLDDALSDGADDSDTSSQDGSSVAGGAGPQQGQIEGLHKPRTRASSSAAHTATTEEEDDTSAELPPPSLLRVVFPLLSNPALLGWSMFCAALMVACVSLPALQAPLQLAPLDARVVLPVLLGREGDDDGPELPAWILAVVPPLAVFFLAEAVKFAASFRATTGATKRA